METNPFTYFTLAVLRLYGLYLLVVGWGRGLYLSLCIMRFVALLNSGLFPFELRSMHLPPRNFSLTTSLRLDTFTSR